MNYSYDRYLIPTVVALAPIGMASMWMLCDRGFKDWKEKGGPALSKVIFITLIVLILFISGFSDHRYSKWRHGWAWEPGQLDDLVDMGIWFQDNVNETDIIGSTNPWDTFYQTEIPTVAIPLVSQSALSDFISNYSIDYIVIDHYHLYRWLDNMASHPVYENLSTGSDIVSVGPYSMIKTYVSDSEKIMIYRVIHS